MNYMQKKIALYRLGYTAQPSPRLDETVWVKDGTTYTEKEVELVLKQENKWVDDFDLHKLKLI